ncbi:MAG TPA: hypothetical protein VMB50_14800 [Myxococcales bacterium]|nr:hypothetical protein [Myxococcales bacterium]
MPENPPPEPQAELEPEENLSLAHYFGGYAIIFFGAIGLALTLVVLMKLMR